MCFIKCPASNVEKKLFFCRFLSLSKNLNVTVGDKKETFGKESTNAPCGRFEGPAERGEFQWIYIKCKKYLILLLTAQSL